MVDRTYLEYDLTQIRIPLSCNYAMAFLLQTGDTEFRLLGFVLLCSPRLIKGYFTAFRATSKSTTNLRDAGSGHNAVNAPIIVKIVPLRFTLLLVDRVGGIYTSQPVGLSSPVFQCHRLAI